MVDYSRLFQRAIKNDELAAEVQEVERNEELDPNLSKDLVRSAIQQRYTVPT
jgi:hypothetical protein